MKILGKITGVVSKTEICAYQCWMCGAGHVSPAEYLRHINACRSEVIAIRAL